VAYNEKHNTKKAYLQDAERTPGMAAVSLYRAEGPDDDIAGPSPISALVAGQIPGAQGTESPGYLEILAKGVQDEATLKLDETCSPGYFILGQCDNGHHFAKEVLCGREWCRVCGEDDSVAHKRRVARWLPRAQQISSMGYFVFTLPLHIRQLYRTREKLNLLTKQLTAGDKSKHIVGLLKSMGFERGLCRWHWFGDKSVKYHPHLNVIVDGSYISPEQLDAIKVAWAQLLGVGVADVFYEYTDEPGKMFHILKYVTRATFHKLEWDEWLAAHIYRFRNMRVWGEWGHLNKEGVWVGQLPVWQVHGRDKLPEIAELEAGRCPICKTEIHWHDKPLPMPYLRAWGDAGMALPLGAKYWQLPGD